MNQAFLQSGYFHITSEATQRLTNLIEEFRKPLGFRLYCNTENKISLRIHDKLYANDWVININGVLVSMSADVLKMNKHIVLDCLASSNNKCGYTFILELGGESVTSLPGDQALSRIQSEEKEVCDAYGEYCYSTYT